MKSSITWVALAALAASACEHPMAHARLPGPLPASGLPDVVSEEGEQAVLASRTLQTLLRDHLASSGGTVALPRAAGGAPPRLLTAPGWLETQSALLRTLADRSRAAALAADDANEHK